MLADEVYEHVLFDGRRHASVLAHPELRERSFAVFSFGKTLHATGWRIGYCVAPPELTRELRKVHQFNTFSIVSPLQYAIARYLSSLPRCVGRTCRILPGQARSARGAAAAARVSSPCRRPALIFNWSTIGALSSDDDMEFADRLIREAKVATIPLSPFYAAAAAHDSGAALHRQAGCDARRPRPSGCCAYAQVLQDVASGSVVP